MSGTQYIAGIALLLAVVGAGAGAAALVTRARLSHLPALERAVAWLTLTVAGVIAVHLVPLTLGVLDRWTVLVAALALLGGATRVPAGDAAPRDTDRGPAGAEPDLLGRVCAALASLSVIGWSLAFVARHADTPIATSDAMNFHLPQVGRWIQSGSLWQIDQFVPGWAFGNYPNSGNVLQLAAILPFDGDAFVRLAILPALVLTGLATVAAARRAGAPMTTAIVLGSAVSAIPTVYAALDYAIVDPLTFAGVAVAVLFLLRHAGTRRRSDLLLAGLGLGLALGTKWYGLPAAIVLGLAWGAAAAAGRRDRRAALGDAVVLAAVAGASGGIWMVRNLVMSGNPVFPAKVAPLGVTVFDAPPDPIREQIGFSIAHYLVPPDGEALSTLAGRVWDAFGPTPFVLAVAALAGLAVAMRDVRARRVGAVLGLALTATAVVLLAVYVTTPYTAQGLEGNPRIAGSAARYGLPAVIVAAVAAGWLIARLPRLRVAAEVGGVVLVAWSIARADQMRMSPFDIVSPAGLGAIAGVLAALAVTAFLIVMLRQGRRVPAAAGLVVVLLGLIVAGERTSDRFDAGRYHGINAAYDWIDANAPRDARIGLAGLWDTPVNAPPWIMFGPDLDRDVRYIGPVVRERLARYRTAGAYQRALRAGRYDLVLFARPKGARNPEGEWAVSAGWRPVAGGDGYTVLAPPAGQGSP